MHSRIRLVDMESGIHAYIYGLPVWWAGTFKPGLSPVQAVHASQHFYT